MLKVCYITEHVVFLHSFESIHSATVVANATQWSVAVQLLDAETSVRHPRSCRVAVLAELLETCITTDALPVP